MDGFEIPFGDAACDPRWLCGVRFVNTTLDKIHFVYQHQDYQYEQGDPLVFFLKHKDQGKVCTVFKWEGDLLYISVIEDCVPEFDMIKFVESDTGLDKVRVCPPLNQELKWFVDMRYRMYELLRPGCRCGTQSHSISAD